MSIISHQQARPAPDAQVPDGQLAPVIDIGPKLFKRMVEEEWRRRGTDASIPPRGPRRGDDAS